MPTHPFAACRRGLVAAASGTLVATAAPGQTPDRERIVITATRTATDPFDLAYAVDSIAAQDILRRAYRTTPQVLRDTPGVMVQETAHGHGSPYIRGFTSFRTLMMVDGVRLNHSAFRPGPNQYWNTVDPLSLERVEVVKGPSSVLYGSDAIGGTVSVWTAGPTFAPPATEGLFTAGRLWTRYASAEDSVQGRGEISVAHDWHDGARTGLLVGGSAKAFGDLEGGRGNGTQPETGYDETDLDIKLEHWFDEDARLVVYHQRVAQNDVPRTHRTIHAIPWRGLSQGSDLRRNFDQRRELSYVQYHHDGGGGAIDTLRANLSWHRHREVRDRIRGNGNQEFQGFEVGTLGAWLQMEATNATGHWTVGVEYYRDHVDSFFRRAGTPQPGDEIQGPVADDATYDLLGVYIQDRIEAGDRVELILGGRFNFAAANADSVRAPTTSTRISIDDDWSAFVGSARALWRALPEHVNVYAGVSQGFRAPNLSDLTRFDSARSNEFEIPALGLQPEDYLTYEVGTKVETEAIALETAYFYTDIEDQILRFPTGNTSTAGEVEVTKGNVGDGHVYGIELGFACEVAPATTLFGNATYMEGRITNFENSSSTLAETYLTRLMPFTAQLGLRWEDERGRFWAEGVVVRAEDADRLSFNDEGDTSRIPPGGTPSYTVAHLRSGWNVSDRSRLHVLLENITDVDYRIHGSGLNRPGRNLVLSFETSF